jgi:cytoskeletal protein CcmA (bactofilin family)
MALFHRDGKDSAPPLAARDGGARARVTHIAPGSRFVGELLGATEVLVDGELEGSIRLDGNLTIGSEGRVQGEVEARCVRIAGKVVGNVRGRERVEVLGSGALEGDVGAPRVVISEGAYFKGRVEMTGSEKTEPESGERPAPRPGSEALATERSLAVETKA